MKLIDLKKVLKNKVRLIFLIGFFCAVCAAGLKYLFTPELYYNGDFIYTRFIQLEDEKDLTNSIYEFNYIGVIHSTNSALKFIEKTDGIVFDYSKINSSWKRINQQQRVEWLRNRIALYNYHDNVFEIVFVVPSSNVSDLIYLSKKVHEFMDLFVSNGNELIREVKPHAMIKTVNSAVILPEEVKNDKKRIALKNAFYGFIAGIFLSVAVFIGIPLFKETQK